MRTTDVVIIGGRGNGTAVQAAIEAAAHAGQSVSVLGFLNDGGADSLDGSPVLDRLSPESVGRFLHRPSTNFTWALTSSSLREDSKKRFEYLKIPKERLQTIVDPSAFVSRTAKLGSGVVVHAFSYIAPGASIGDNSVIWPQTFIGTNAVLGEFSYVAANASVGASATLAEGAYLGMNAVARERTHLGYWSVAGMGAVVIKPVEDFQTVVGNPARPI